MGDDKKPIDINVFVGELTTNQRILLIFAVQLAFHNDTSMIEAIYNSLEDSLMDLADSDKLNAAMNEMFDHYQPPPFRN